MRSLSIMAKGSIFTVFDTRLGVEPLTAWLQVKCSDHLIGLLWNKPIKCVWIAQVYLQRNVHFCFVLIAITSRCTRWVTIFIFWQGEYGSPSWKRGLRGGGTPSFVIFSVFKSVWMQNCAIFVALPRVTLTWMKYVLVLKVKSWKSPYKIRYFKCNVD